ncbi:unnamed protein product [Pieris macdunnoughi]|uniref:DDE-1 domain-containing protein n=1 Tax=Pieris macdunnoughi TaxID=345717 RepID=A0A821SUU1_9NEOP|nr:unnamed protein product [Pieris macdunnoughi]
MSSVKESVIQLKKKSILFRLEAGESNATIERMDYESNQRAWMTADIFNKWIRAWDRELMKKKILFS